MKCTCGYEVHEPPYENWEECGDCEQRLHNLEWQKKQLEDLKALRTVGSLLHSLLRQAYLFKGYGTGPLQQPAVDATLKQWETLNNDM